MCCASQWAAAAWGAGGGAALRAGGECLAPRSQHPSLGVRVTKAEWWLTEAGVGGRVAGREGHAPFRPPIRRALQGVTLNIHNVLMVLLTFKVGFVV